jgi:diguanylate cyclase
MTVHVEQKSDQHRLHRKVLKTYWVVFLISIIAELVAFVIKLNQEIDMLHAYVVHKMIIPSVLQLIILGISETAYRMKKDLPWLIILSGTCIAAALVIANKSIHIQFIFLLSMLVSVYAVFPLLRQNMSIYEVFAFVFIMIGMVFILREVILRGRDMLDDLTRMARTEQELLVKNALMDRMVKMDALTDLYNHKTFHQYLEMLIEQSDNNRVRLQLAVIDIDNFKSVNDTYGHSVGDMVLTRVANALKEAFASHEVVARFGGEEFAVIFLGRTLEQVCREMEQVRERISQVEHREMDGRRVTISIGLAEHRPGTTKPELFAKVDALLYAAKRSGKNKTVIPGMTVANLIEGTPLRR